MMTEVTDEAVIQPSSEASPKQEEEEEQIANKSNSSGDTQVDATDPSAYQNKRRKVEQELKKLRMDSNLTGFRGLGQWFACTKCFVEFNCEVQLLSHQNAFHKEGNHQVGYRCSICCELFSQLETFIQHQTCTDRHKHRLGLSDNCVCLLCGCAQLRPHLNAHLVEKHTDAISSLQIGELSSGGHLKQINCNLCSPNLVCKSKTELLTHLSSWHSTCLSIESLESVKMEQCYLCNQSFSTIEFRHHVINAHCPTKNIQPTKPAPAPPKEIAKNNKKTEVPKQSTVVDVKKKYKGWRQTILDKKKVKPTPEPPPTKTKRKPSPTVEERKTTKKWGRPFKTDPSSSTKTVPHKQTPQVAQKTKDTKKNATSTQVIRRSKRKRRRPVPFEESQTPTKSPEKEDSDGSSENESLDDEPEPEQEDMSAKCTHCFTNFSQSEQLALHLVMGVCRPTASLFCPICGDKLMNWQAWQHIMQKHSSKQQLGGTFKNVAMQVCGLKGQERSKSRHGLTFPCHFCELDFSENALQRVHMTLLHPKPKTSADPKQEQKVKPKRTESPPPKGKNASTAVPCRWCGHNFRRLNKHKWACDAQIEEEKCIAAGERARTVPCSKCGALFGSETAYAVHVNVMHKDESSDHTDEQDLRELLLDKKETSGGLPVRAAHSPIRPIIRTTLPGPPTSPSPEACINGVPAAETQLLRSPDLEVEIIDETPVEQPMPKLAPIAKRNPSVLSVRTSGGARVIRPQSFKVSSTPDYDVGAFNRPTVPRPSTVLSVGGHARSSREGSLVNVLGGQERRVIRAPPGLMVSSSNRSILTPPMSVVAKQHPGIRAAGSYSNMGEYTVSLDEKTKESIVGFYVRVNSGRRFVSIPRYMIKKSYNDPRAEPNLPETEPLAEDGENQEDNHALGDIPSPKSSELIEVDVENDNVQVVENEQKVVIVCDDL